MRRFVFPTALALLLVGTTRLWADVGPSVPNLDVTSEGTPQMIVAGVAIAVGLALCGVWVARMRQRSVPLVLLGTFGLLGVTLVISCCLLPWSFARPPRPRPPWDTRLETNPSTPRPASERAREP